VRTPDDAGKYGDAVRDVRAENRKSEDGTKGLAGNQHRIRT
jgi:hypothetical protein